MLTFLIFFGIPYVEKYKEKNVMIVKNTKHTGGIEAPAITIVSRNPQSKQGWKNVPKLSSTQELVHDFCGENNVEKCIREKTFGHKEVVKDVTIGFDAQKSVMDLEHWTEDFTSAWMGRSYTLKIEKNLHPDYEDELFVQFDYDRLHDIFIHDRNFFIVNLNLLSLPTIYKRLNPNTTTSHFYQFSLTEVEELNLPKDPCNEDKSYLFQACIKKSISEKFGCKFGWDVWSDRNLPICSTRKQIR